MSYLVLARKWRPQTFEEVVGQAHVTRTLQNAISSSRVAHGYLFTGPRGVGKTSTARILAKALNCAKGPTPSPCGQCDSCLDVAGQGSVDVIEIDGASNNGVENIRDLREKVNYAGMRDRHKIYIIDEVHMLSASAFNALLKTLEEPPSHVIFIFATTDVQKVPATILSRIQRFDFRRIGARDLGTQLKKILDAEGIVSSSEALSLVARAASGSMRDAQTLLDQIISYAGGKAITAEDVLQVLGGVQESQCLSVLLAGLKGEAEPGFEWVRQIYERGADFRMALEMLQELLRGLLLLKSSPKAAEATELTVDSIEALGGLASQVGLSRLLTLLKAVGEAESQLRFTSNPRLVLELFLIRLSASQPQGTLGELFDELAAIEKRLAARGDEAPEAPARAPLPPVAASASKEKEAGTPEKVVEEISEVPAPAAVTLEGLKSGWDKVVEKAGHLSLMLGASVKDAELASLSGGQLLLKVHNAKQKETLELADNRRRLEGALMELFGVKLEVKALFSAPVVPQAKPVAAASARPSAEEVEKLLQESPGIRRIQELFNAEITEVKRT